MADELKVKKEEFLRLHSPLKIELHEVSKTEFRTRMDVSWDGLNWGFFARSINSPSVSPIVSPIDTCILASLPLQEFFTEFRTLQLPFKKASARLRVSPEGKRGLWLDLANLDIKSLLQDKVLIEKFSKLLGFQEPEKLDNFEIGQKRKKIQWRDSEKRYSLGEPESSTWINTYALDPEDLHKKNILPKNLFCHVGGFSQTGPQSLELITRILNQYFNQKNQLARAPRRTLLEFGSGYGSLTIPISAFCKSVIALEISELAVTGLKQSLDLHKITNVEIRSGDFQRKKNLDFISTSTLTSVLVNPPRSGVGDLFNNLTAQIEEVIYMSCHLESFNLDSEILKTKGFSLDEAHLINQFPYTPHSEWLTFWRR
jgi:23S rRNA (uracil1939-C5)-methyltransferase